MRPWTLFPSSHNKLFSYLYDLCIYDRIKTHINYVCTVITSIEFVRKLPVKQFMIWILCIRPQSVILVTQNGQFVQDIQFDMAHCGYKMTITTTSNLELKKTLKLK